jgi:integrase/transcription elongation factor Elf1
MTEINWKQDYQGEFTCPKCKQGQVKLNGFWKGAKMFKCPECKKNTLAFVLIKKHPPIIDEHIDWQKDYQNEFFCPACETRGMRAWGIRRYTNKRYFQCSTCKKIQKESCDINIKAIDDPINKGVKWYTDHRIQDFICPKCQNNNLYLTHIDKDGKKRFKCRKCQFLHYDSITLTAANRSRYSNQSLQIKQFNWLDDQWDLRTINPNFDKRDSRYYLVSFTSIHLEWFKQEVKKYVKHLCVTGNSLGTIQGQLSSFRSFSRYLGDKNIPGFTEINRSLILDYLSKSGENINANVRVLNKFFRVGNIQNWFNIDQDIIRDEDYPKQYQGNPDPISEMVREQIERNLYILPDPIARMWLIGYFSAMRPSELALLKQDCLVQEGQYWKLVWYRKKTRDYHEIPISRTIAQVVQQQQEYIQNLWGNEWDYLFCHYHNLSSIYPSQPNLEPVKKILPTHTSHPLLVGIRTLITALNIRDENKQLAEFTSKLLRPTRLTELYKQGHDLAVVAMWAGHKKSVTTKKFYTEINCELIQKESGHIQQALVNKNGYRVLYESFPKSFWENPTAHKLELANTHINTPIYGLCGLPLDQDCYKFRACYTCESFVATDEKLPEYIQIRDELRAKQSKAMSAEQEVLAEQFGKQADQLDKIIASLQQEVA